VLHRSIVVAVTLLAAAVAPAAAQQYTPGSPGVGDPFFPQAGNGGYDVRHYSLDLNYDPHNNSLEARATIAARATQDLSRFDLDLRGLHVGQVTVNGDTASFKRDGQELVITPSDGLRRGRGFEVRVNYNGHPNHVLDPDKSRDGWILTDDGAFVVNEPQGTPTWYPVNDTLKDKATYDFMVTVPKDRSAIGNGVLVSKKDNGDTFTWHWRESVPMASYLATVTNGVFETRFGQLPIGLPQYDAVDPQTRRFGQKDPEPDLAWRRLAVEPEAVDFLIDLYGPYPFDSVGGIVDWAPNVFFSLESQTKPNYWVVPSTTTIVHELAHQWFGDSVTLAVWPDMWLNEGFATWSEWIWTERHQGPSAQETFDDLYATPEGSEAGQDLWFPAPAALPGPEVLFATPVYDRGAMTLQALRQKVGDTVFLQILRNWYGEHRGGNVTTADFIALAERDSGQQLDQFFNAWLFTPGKPTSW
jgi:aminopeptidase N